MTTPQHDDPLGEGLGKVLRALAVLTTIGESAARFAATGTQNRAAKAERQAHAERIADAARRQADQAARRAYAAQQRADRRLMDLAFDDAWLAAADIHTTAHLWRTAAMYAMGGDRRAAEVMRRAHDRLATLNPGLIDAYNRHRDAGMNIADAMRAAAHEVWQHQTRPTPARPHGNTGEPPAALTLGPRAIGATPDPAGQRLVDELEAATRAEVTRLATDVDPDVLDRLQRQWRSAGHAPAADAAALLANAARQLRADGVLSGPVTGTATARRGVNHANDTDRPPTSVSADTDTVDVPIRATLAAYEIAAQGFDRAADAVRAGQAAERHMTGLADQQHRSASVDQGLPDLPATVTDEHREGLVTGHIRRGRAEHDQAAADQQRRLGRAFRPLSTVTPVFSHSPSPLTSQPAPTRRRGSTR